MSPKAATHWRIHFSTNFSNNADNLLSSRAWAARDELAPNLRSFLVKKFVIFYRPVDDTIEIVRILYGGRDIDSIFGDDVPTEQDENAS